MQRQAWLSHMIMGPRQSHDQQGPCLPFNRPDQLLSDFAGTVRSSGVVVFLERMQEGLEKITENHREPRRLPGNDAAIELVDLGL